MRRRGCRARPSAGAGSRSADPTGRALSLRGRGPPPAVRTTERLHRRVPSTHPSAATYVPVSSRTRRRDRAASPPPPPSPPRPRADVGADGCRPRRAGRRDSGRPGVEQQQRQAAERSADHPARADPTGCRSSPTGGKTDDGPGTRIEPRHRGQPVRPARSVGPGGLGDYQVTAHRTSPRRVSRHTPSLDNGDQVVHRRGPVPRTSTRSSRPVGVVPVAEGPAGAAGPPVPDTRAGNRTGAPTPSRPVPRPGPRAATSGVYRFGTPSTGIQKYRSCS